VKQIEMKDYEFAGVSKNSEVNGMCPLSVISRGHHKDSALCFQIACPGSMIEQARSWLAYTKFSHSGPQRAAVEPKDLGRPVFSADFPLSLLEDSHNMFALNRFEFFLRS